MRSVTRLTIASILVLACAAAVAAPPECRKASTFTETFADESNVGNWWHHFNVLQTDKGKNKEHFYSGEISTFFPRTGTRGPSDEFTGDWSDKNVIEFSIDLATLAAPQIRDYTSMSPTLSLVNYNGTPEDLGDDCIVFFQSGRPIPEPDPGNIGWTKYTFEVPSTSATLPQPNNGDPCPGGFCETCILTGDPLVDTQQACWGVFKGNNCPVLDDFDAVWRQVIENVDEVRVWWMSPEWFALIQPWQTAVDNPSITTCND